MTDYQDHLFYGASQNIRKRARELRMKTTGAEDLLWRNLRNRRLKGLKFRRQHPVVRFIADFYCHEKKVVVEVDGGIHQLDENRKYDEGRTAELESFGIKVIRFANEDVFQNIDRVLEEIERICIERESYC